MSEEQQQKQEAEEQAAPAEAKESPNLDNGYNLDFTKVGTKDFSSNINKLFNKDSEGNVNGKDVDAGETNKEDVVETKAKPKAKPKVKAEVKAEAKEDEAKELELKTEAISKKAESDKKARNSKESKEILKSISEIEESEEYPTFNSSTSTEEWDDSVSEWEDKDVARLEKINELKKQYNKLVKTQKSDSKEAKADNKSDKKETKPSDETTLESKKKESEDEKTQNLSKEDLIYYDAGTSIDEADTGDENLRAKLIEAINDPATGTIFPIELAKFMSESFDKNLVADLTRLLIESPRATRIINNTPKSQQIQKAKSLSANLKLSKPHGGDKTIETSEEKVVQTSYTADQLQSTVPQESETLSKALENGGYNAFVKALHSGVQRIN